MQPAPPTVLDHDLLARISANTVRHDGDRATSVDAGRERNDNRHRQRPGSMTPRRAGDGKADAHTNDETRFLSMAPSLRADCHSARWWSGGRLDAGLAWALDDEAVSDKSSYGVLSAQVSECHNARRRLPASAPSAACSRASLRGHRRDPARVRGARGHAKARAWLDSDADACPLSSPRRSGPCRSCVEVRRPPCRKNLPTDAGGGKTG